jgi:hypothetical protein
MMQTLFRSVLLGREKENVLQARQTTDTKASNDWPPEALRGKYSRIQYVSWADLSLLLCGFQELSRQTQGERRKLSL